MLKSLIKTIISQTGQHAVKVYVRPSSKWTKILVIEHVYHNQSFFKTAAMTL